MPSSRSGSFQNTTVSEIETSFPDSTFTNEWSHCSTPAIRSHEQGESAVENQCIFIRGFVISARAASNKYEDTDVVLEYAGNNSLVRVYHLNSSDAHDTSISHTILLR